MQLANMQENERVKSIAMMKYAENVASPTRNKQLQAEMTENSQANDRNTL